MQPAVRIKKRGQAYNLNIVNHEYKNGQALSIANFSGYCPFRAGRVIDADTQGGACFADLPWAFGCRPFGPQEGVNLTRPSGLAGQRDSAQAPR